MTVEEAATRLRLAQEAEARAKAAVLKAQAVHKEAQDTARTAWLEHRNIILNARRSRRVVVH